MKYRFLVLMYPLFLQGMDELQFKKRFGAPEKNTDYQDPVKVAQGKLIENYREGGDELFQEKKDKLSRILQEHGVKANTVVRIALRIEKIHHQFDIFSPRNKKLEAILESENINPRAVSDIVEMAKDIIDGVKIEEVKDEHIHDAMEIERDE